MFNKQSPWGILRVWISQFARQHKPKGEDCPGRMCLFVLNRCDFGLKISD